MKKTIMFLSCTLIFSLVNAGVSSDTLVETTQGSKEIGLLNVGDEILSFDKDFSQSLQSIITIEEAELDAYIEITTQDDEIIRVSPDQRLFVPQKWVQADLLSLGDVLLKKDRTFIRIKSICLKQEPLKLRFITIDGYKNFFISRNGVLIHNGPLLAAIGYTVTKTLCYGTAVAAVGSLAVATGGAGAAVVNTALAATTVNAPAGVALTATAIAEYGVASEAAVTTVGVISSAGGVMEAVALVETLSCTVAWVGGLVPFL